VRALREPVAEIGARPVLDPVLGVEVVGVAEHDRQLSGAVANGDAAAARGLGVRDDVERRLRGVQLDEVDRLDAQRGGEFGNFSGNHRMLPASSKMGMYMRTTTAPTARPSAVMSSGSKARVNQSMKRATSSSWKRAIWPSMPPMSPPRSPTSIIRVATGVARPAAPSATDIGLPCSISFFAAASCGRR